MTDPSGNERLDADSLSADGSSLAAETIADLSAAGLPLADGLRAVAAEASRGRVARQLNGLAARLESGQTLEEILAAPGSKAPHHLTQLIQAATRTQQIGPVLAELVDHQRTIHELRRSTRAVLSYPLFLLLFALAIGVWIELAVVGPIAEMVAGMAGSQDLPYLTVVLIWIYDSGMWILLGIAVLTVVALSLLRLIGGAARWRRVLSTVPLFGSLWHWAGVADFCRLVAVFVEQDLTLPESLRLAAEGVQDGNVREIAVWLAEGAEQGRPLSELLRGTHRLPATLRPLLAWGERTRALPEAFRMAAEMFLARIQLRTELINAIVPPLVFVLVALAALLALAGLYGPMSMMIRYLM